jgi:hypothetical protein
VITYDGFYDAILPLAQWKHKKGMRSKVVKLSEIGSSALDIKNYIADAYNTWDIPPRYVLFVGAPNYIPLPTVEGERSDNYYTNITGDLYNEVLSGRLTVHSSFETQTVVNKILLYERTPYMADSLWFKKATLLVRRDFDPPDDSIYFSDAFFAAECMVNEGFVEVDTFSDMYGNTVTDLLNATNEGRSIIMYRGSGVNNWPSPFNINPDVLQNGAKLPIVLSITCCTMGTGSTPATAERWLLTGTPTVPRGASGYFATTTVIVGGAHLRSAVAKGFHRALFIDNARTFGEACEGGRKNVYEMYPYQAGKDEYYGFHTLGDPEMNIWTDTPCSLIVTHPLYAIYGYSVIQIRVRDALLNQPIEGALICLCGKEDTTVYVCDNTNALGEVTFEISPRVIEDTIFVTVTGRNLKPYEGFMTVLHADAYVVYLSSAINDTVGGNSDGFINPTEQIELPLKVINFGESTAVDIYGRLRTSDTLITITDSSKYFGDILGLDSATTGPDGYNFSISFYAPNMHSIEFELECRDAYDSIWTSNFSRTVYAPELSLEGFGIQGGNGNNTLEPAETVEVVITLKNYGGAAADDVSGTLYTSSPYAVILDSTGLFGHIGVDTALNNAADPYIVAVHDTTPTGTFISCSLVVVSNFSLDTFDLDLIVGQRNYYVWNPDPTPLPGQNMHQILSASGYDGDYGVSMPSYLTMYQTLFVCLGVYSTRYIIDQNSPEVTAITDFLNGGGRVYLEGSSAWFIDPLYFDAYDFGPMFGIQGIDWSLQDLGPLIGENSTFTSGMHFIYGGENWYMDHLQPQAEGYVILSDSNDYYTCGIARSAGTYRTVGTNFELGLLNDGVPPSDRKTLLDSIMHFFGVYSSSVEEHKPETPIHQIFLSITPNPSIGVARITSNINNFAGIKGNDAILKIFDITGRLIRSYSLSPTQHGMSSSTVVWSGKDDNGQKVPQGVYFVELCVGTQSKTAKLIFLR